MGLVQSVIALGNGDVFEVHRAFFRHDYFDIPQILITLKAETFIPGGLQ